MGTEAEYRTRTPGLVVGELKRRRKVADPVPVETAKLNPDEWTKVLTNVEDGLMKLFVSACHYRAQRPWLSESSEDPREQLTEAMRVAIRMRFVPNPAELPALESAHSRGARKEVFDKAARALAAGHTDVLNLFLGQSNDKDPAQFVNRVFRAYVAGYESGTLTSDPW